MLIAQTQYDERNNLIAATLFETYLAKFILEHPHYYQEVYFKVFDTIQNYLSADPLKNPKLKFFLESQSARYDFQRHQYTLFSKLTESFKEQTSFDTLRTHFNLLSANHFIKLILDEFLPDETILKNTLPNIYSFQFFSASTPRRSPNNPNRSTLLFSPENRGANEIDYDEEPGKTHAIGIVSPRFLPNALKHYFDSAIDSTRDLFSPNEDSYVAMWLRERNLPLMTGASGSTEALISRLFPMCALSEDEKKLLIFAQACAMVANGFHSFFEAMIVLDHLGQGLDDTATLLDYYLQCVPDVIREDASFIAFLSSEPIQSLLKDIPLYNERRHNHAA